MQRIPFTLASAAIALGVVGVPLFVFDPNIGLVPLWVAAMLGVVIVVRRLADAGARLKERAEREGE